MAVALRTIELRLLGEPALLAGGSPVSFAGFPRLPAMLAYLALNDGPVRRDHLAFTLWPDDLESAARANLRRALHRLQTLLGDDSGILDITTTSLALRRDALACDVWELETLLERAGDEADIARAMHLYRNGLLPSFEDEWIAPLQERLRARVLACADRALQAAAARNDPAAVQRHARAVLIVDPFREEAVRQLMNALAQNGDRSGALAEYRAFAQRLREEFDVEPDAQTVRLHETLASTAPVRRTHNLPFEIDPFVGRAGELAQLAQAFETRRAVTVCGPPGVGKSRLALHYAHTVRESGGEAWFVQLAPARRAQDIVDALLAALRAAVQPQEEPLDALCRAIGEGSPLLLLDTAEHIVAPAGEVLASLLARCPNVRALVTSREALHIAGEATLRIEPLALDQAKRLLRDRVAAASGSLATPDDAILEALCLRLEGIPLALELAAARASAFTLTDIARGLERDSSALRAPRRKTLEETIAWSYDFLDPEEQRCLRALAIFEDTFAIDAAAAVCGIDGARAEDAVASLVDKSFAHAVDARSGRRYAFYQSVRDFALRRSDASERERARAAFVEHFRELAARTEPQLSGAHQSAALDLLHDERANLDAMLWQAERNNSAWGASFALALYRFWLTRGSYAAALRAMEHFSKAAPSPSLRAQCCANAAVLATLLGDVKRSERLLECARAEPEIEDAALLDVHHAAGVVAHERGDIRAGREHFVAALACARRTGDEPKIARALGNIGTVDALLENFESAREALEESLGLYRKLGGEENIAWVLYHLAGLAFERGEYDDALRLNAESFQLRKALDHAYGIALCYGGMGQAQFALGRFDEAQQSYMEALRLWHAGGQRSSVALALEALAAIAVTRKQYRRAGVLTHAAERLRADLAIGMRPHEAQMRERTLAQAEREAADEFEQGRSDAQALSENDCVAFALVRD